MRRGRVRFSVGIRVSLALSLCGCLLATRPAHGADDDSRLTRFKAVFLYNFIDYVHWPQDRATGTFKVGILGSSPLELPLREIAQKKKVWGHPLQIDVFDKIEAVRPCHMLFIAPAFSARVADLSARLSATNGLTVTDAPGMAAQGAAINFVLEKGKLKFEVNRESLARAGLKASAQLLKLAILVPSATADSPSEPR